MSSFNNFWKRKSVESTQGPPDLAAKVASSGDLHVGYGLASSSSAFSRGSNGEIRRNMTGEAASRALESHDSGSNSFPLHRTRLFQTPSTRHCHDASSDAHTPGVQTTFSTASRSRFTSFTERSTTTHPPAVHVVCAISENMARETCIVSMDAGSPTTLQVTKQGNGQAYSETLSYLSILQPHEILFNDGRRKSLLARKIMEHYDLEDDSPHAGILQPTARRRKTQAPTRNFRKSSNTGQNPVNTAAARIAAPDDDRTLVKFISRGLFDQTKGAALLKSIAREDTYEPLVVEEYIILSAAHALIVYMQQGLGASLAEKSLNLTINADGTNRMMIDRASLWQLELLLNAKTGKTKNSLVGTIDFTKTSVGARLLRTNIMSPPTDVGTINSRLELVDTFLASEELFNEVYEHLSRLPELDTMLSNVGLVPNRTEVKGDEPTSAYVRMARQGISALISIKTTLFALPALARALAAHLAHLEARQGDDEQATIESSRTSLLIGLGAISSVPGNMSRNFLLRAIIQVMSEPLLMQMLEMVDDAFTESTTYSKNPTARQHHECFALKEPSNSFLGRYRQTFINNVDDIYKEADKIAEAHGIHVTVRYSSGRGYYLAVPASFGQDLPAEFLNCSKNNRSITFTTKDAAEHNLRARECVRDILVMTHDRTQQILSQVRENYDALARLSDAIAMLDMCHSFADNVALSPGSWCRPFVSDPQQSRTMGCLGPGNDASTTAGSGVALLIRNGRFAITTPDTAASKTDEGHTTPFVANDTYASVDKNFTVITGINGSGKSTYLKQIAIIVVLAHCGSYVPAEQASITVRDRLCTRIGNVDDQEHSISTFMMEMRETAFICNNATSKSLILLDELGRATSNEEGMSLAWAVAEYLLKRRALTFFVTHYPQLNRLAETYPNVQNLHLDASIERGGINNIMYTHKVKSGPCVVSTDYGVALAAACAWPGNVITTARSLETRVQELLPSGSFCNAGSDEELEFHTRAFDNILDIHSELLALGHDESATLEEFRDALISLQDRLAPSEDEELCQRMCRLLMRGMDRQQWEASSVVPDDESKYEPSGVNPYNAETSVDSFDNDDGLVGTLHDTSDVSSDASTSTASSLSDD